MRKLLALAFIVMLALLVVGCTKVERTDIPPKEQESQAGVEETEVSEDINAADEDTSDLSSETAENLDRDLEDFDW